MNIDTTGLDEESIKFVNWAIPRFYQLYNVYVQKGLNEAFHFFNNNKKHIMARFKDKLVKGSLEHGPPIYSEEITTHELQQEFLDIIGWTLVREYNENLKAKT